MSDAKRRPFDDDPALARALDQASAPPALDLAATIARVGAAAPARRRVAPPRVIAAIAATCLVAVGVAALAPMWRASGAVDPAVVADADAFAADLVGDSEIEALTEEF